MSYQNMGSGLGNLTATEISYCLQSQGAPDENWWGEYT